ncbi:MAG TPA: flagellar biosynthetic protein FliR [Thermodesulfovibrionales bacterium]|nr:flagellar biosynthetic protein FliR [Thermodesulfovibrionales bacterium]
MNTNFFTPYIHNFLFILLRAGIVIVLLPFFGSANFPAQIKIGLAVAVAVILAPIIDIKIPGKGAIPLMVIHEVLLGMTFAFVARVVFFAIEMAGQMISNAMGLSIANVFNPEIGQSTEMSQLLGFIVMLVFLSMDAHHDLIYMFVRSYEWLPAGEMSIGNLVPVVVSLGSTMFIIALKLSAPVILTMVISHMLLGFVYKAAPQINIFFVAYPIYIVVGLVVLIVGMPVLLGVTGNYIGTIKDEMARVLIAVKG